MINNYLYNIIIYLYNTILSVMLITLVKRLTLKDLNL